MAMSYALPTAQHMFPPTNKGKKEIIYASTESFA
jgi:hypothetical protein